MPFPGFPPQGGKDTVEFRVFSGSLNPIKVLGWIQVCLGLMERALSGKRMPKWNPGPLTGGWALDPDAIEVDEVGKVARVSRHGGGRDAWQQIDVAWDNGRTLMLVSPPDEFEIVREKD